ncbi:opacity protein-like surface antigen [Sphingomonas zeicaulis]|uniref:hypothetical protein n=1 Tax=Sphingomonas zeicaulis TaxID=1632740 RepID=UPI003D1A456B
MHVRLTFATLCATLLLPAASAPAADNPVVGGAPVPASGGTRVLDRKAAQRLLANKGLTLQWIDWNTRGTARVRADSKGWTLRGSQVAKGGPGRLELDGRITEIGSDYFIFVGRISITDTPDAGRSCVKDKEWRFAITQNRPYYRMREFEWCDDLTDYIDLHF